MRRLLLAAAALLAAVVWAVLPPRPVSLPPPGVRLLSPIRGVVHVHTRRSDGSGTPEQVARAASEAGLRFVILTDHGDGTRIPDAPAYYNDVLVIDAVEISADGGHVVALGLPQTPYPFGGEARDVLEDVHRMGGFTVAAHPTSVKADLRWTDWTLPLGGFEHLNGDSEWRDENAFALARAVIAYPFRPAESMATLFDRSEEAFRRWDALRRPVTALLGADAHGRVSPRGEDPYRGRLALPGPGYAPVFRSASIALAGVELTSNAAAAAAAVIDAIRSRRVFSSIDALAAHPSFELQATSGRHRAAVGGELPFDGPLDLDVRVQAPAEARVVLLRDGAQVLETSPPSLRYHADAPVPGFYRVEVRLPAAPGAPAVPWLVANGVLAGLGGGAGDPPPRSVTDRTLVYGDGPAPGWRVEHAQGSRGAVDVVKATAGTQLLFRYAISGAGSSHPYAALVAPAGSIAGHAQVTLRAQADRPMRLSVQLRAESGTAEGERWHRSVFIDETPRDVTVGFGDMRPRGPTRTPRPRLDHIQWLLFVVDAVNTAPGTAGQVSIDEVRYER